MAKAKGLANLEAFAWSALGPDVPRLDPADVMLRLLHMSWMRVHLHAERLRLLVETERGDGGLVGPTYAAGRDGARVETGEQIRAMAKLEAEERDRCALLAKRCHDMGIAEKSIEIQQVQAQIVVAAYRSSMDAAGPDLLPTTRDVMLRAFLGALGRGPEVAGEVTA